LTSPRGIAGYGFRAGGALYGSRIDARSWSTPLTLLIRRIFAAVLFLGLFAALPPGTWVDRAMAQGADAALAAQPVSLPDMALGPADALVTIVEFSSLTCPHCAAFEQNVFPMLQSRYIDTGKVRFISREFPLDIKAASGSMLARCAAGGDAPKYFEAVDMLFKRQEGLLENTLETMNDVGKHFGMSEDTVAGCVKDQALLDKLSADQKFAYEKLKVDATPYFFVNGERLRGSMSFEELEKKIKPLLKR
jgi:protein-disulfide isomerase